MGSPDWSKISFDKLPEWKKEEMLGKAKHTVDEIEKASFVCNVCGKICKNSLGLNAHKRSH